MLPRSVVGVFCEDIRAEKSGAFTLVGIMPDNANIPVQPTATVRGMIPKLCVYVRANFDVADSIKSLTMTMHLPDGNMLDISSLEPRIIKSAFEMAKKRGSPLAIIVMRAEFQAFPVVQLGQIVVEVNVDGEKYIAAQLKLTQGMKEEPGEEQVSYVEKTMSMKTTSPTA